MPATADGRLPIPEIRALLAVRSGLSVHTAAAEARITPAQVRHVLARVARTDAATPRGRTRR